MGNCECKWVSNFFIVKKQSEKEKKYFNSMKIGLEESIVDIKKTIEPVKDFDSLLNLNSEEEFIKETEELYKQNRLRKSQRTARNIQHEPINKDIYTTWSDICYVINSSKFCKGLCFTCGLFFILIQFIGVQEGIIILNALFEEIIDEFRLISQGTPKEYNFYQKIENASYKSIPEIDIGMFWSFIGIATLKKFGFLWSNLFQFLSLIGFILLFLLFEFHKGNQLLEKYTNIEFTILIFAYIILSITVGGSSMIALKQFMNIYQAFYEDNCNIFSCLMSPFYLLKSISKKCCKKTKDIEESEETSDIFEDKKGYIKQVQSFLFYNFSAFSFLFMVLINRIIITSFKTITSKWLLKSILIVYSSCFVLYLFFYLFFSFPLIRNEIEKQIKKKNDLENKKKLKASEHNENIYYNTQTNLKNNLKQNETEILGLKDKIFKKVENNNEDEQIIEINENISKDPIKICTCIGYLYFQKKIGDKQACIFYDHDSCFSWFWKQLKKPKVYIPFFAELAIQLMVVGFNPILSDYLLKKFSFKKNVKFFLGLLLSIVQINYSLIYFQIFDNILSVSGEVHLFWKLVSFFVSIYFVYAYSFVTFIFSIVYISHKKSYEDTIISEIVLFKIADLHLLSFYDFLDDKDCLNTSVVITFERFLWMIIEVIIDTAETYSTVLVSIQIGISFIASILLIIFAKKFIDVFKKKEKEIINE